MLNVKFQPHLRLKCTLFNCFETEEIHAHRRSKTTVLAARWIKKEPQKQQQHLQRNNNIEKCSLFIFKVTTLTQEKAHTHTHIIAIVFTCSVCATPALYQKEGKTRLEWIRLTV